MQIDHLKISNFKCFGSEPTLIELENDLTFFLGNNGTGKTAVLTALKRLFGSTIEERTIVADDFYLKEDEKYEDAYGRELFIEVVFSFPELNGDVANARETCPAFSTVIYADDVLDLKARIRLEAKWSQDEFDDEVESKIFWVTSKNEVVFGQKSSNHHALSSYDRKSFNFRYVPANRDATTTLRKEIRRLTKLLSDYSEVGGVKDKIKTLSDSLNSEIQSLDSIQTISKSLEKVWEKVLPTPILIMT